ncbi:unnamed protein product [Durusdinium trenchii]|uniref:Glycine-rich RNA-binding protein RZ1C (AtRZ-1C) n=2 Tax=Durusdinium trenchii TaxID=1381693 RepID=A0ABP0SPZ3_9DINO
MKGWYKGDWMMWGPMPWMPMPYPMGPMDFGKGKGYGKGFGAPKEARGLVRAVVSAQVVPGGKWNNDDNTLFVGGLPPDTTNLEMYQIFSAFGPIAPRGATALLDKDTGKCTGIGFINYMNAEAAEKAIRALNSWPFEDGSRLTVKKKGPPKSKGEGKGDRGDRDRDRSEKGERGDRDQ